jgi:hypothetical protein
MISITSYRACVRLDADPAMDPREPQTAKGKPAAAWGNHRRFQTSEKILALGIADAGLPARIQNFS